MLIEVRITSIFVHHYLRENSKTKILNLRFYLFIHILKKTWIQEDYGSFRRIIWY